MSFNKRKIGNIGESIASEFLIQKGFDVVERNYRKNWGEIDIIAKDSKGIHFFEVKSISIYGNVSDNSHRPEENVDGWKLKHIRKMIETYFAEKRGGFDIDFYFHVLCVYLDINTRKARIKWIENVVL